MTILSDIHGNLEALQAVLPRVDRIFPDFIISLGDNIGYGPDPNRVMQEICQRKISSVLGNHEMAIVNPSFMACFNPVSRKAAEHTLGHLSGAYKKIINQWSRNMVLENLGFVHGVPPSSPFIYLFQLTASNLKKRMEAMEQWVYFAGHTHDLKLIAWDGETIQHRELKRGTIVLDRRKKYIVNAGSVGQPRDGDPRAKWLSFDTLTGELTVDFVPYDHGKTAAKILEAGIPAVFAEKLSRRF